MLYARMALRHPMHNSCYSPNCWACVSIPLTVYGKESREINEAEVRGRCDSVRNLFSSVAEQAGLRGNLVHNQ